MTNFSLGIGAILCMSTIMFLDGTGWALDESGCLTCHQYPGLVRVAKDDNVIALHIDESRYAASVHGDVKCIRCHTTIVKVPHTGNRSVDCSTVCHQGDDSPQLPDDYPLADFHKAEQSFIRRLDDQTSCRVCHQLYPHKTNNLVRGFLNMHVGFMTCEVCHYKKKKLNGTTYQWHDSENARFSGEPFGSVFNPASGKAKKPTGFISRITIYAIQNGKRRSRVNTWDTAAAKVYNRKQHALTESEKTTQLGFFHRDIEKKQISVACDQCHSPHSILDYTNLGFDQKKQSQLENLDLKGLVTKYKTFYLPQLLTK
jgi:hypothetical protein